MISIRQLLIISSIVLITVYSEKIDYATQNWEGVCATGQSQSPIDFPTVSANYMKTDNRLTKTNYSNMPFKDIKFETDYKEHAFGIHSIPSNNTISFIKNGEEYDFELLNIHLHIKSEHTIGGKNADVEFHMVHQKKLRDGQEDKDPKYQYLVIGVMYNKGGDESQEIKSQNIGTLNNITDLDLSDWIKTTNPFIFYEGSLTTPTCDEAVQFLIQPDVRRMSDAQYNEIKARVDVNYANTGNYRKVQPLNGRQIYYYPGSYTNFLGDFIENINKFNFSFEPSVTILGANGLNTICVNMTILLSILFVFFM